MLRRSAVTLKSTSNRPDSWLIAISLGLTVFGVIMVGNASVVEALRDFEDKFHYFRLQIQWAALGMIAFFLSLKFNYRRLKALSLPLLIIVLICLVLVLVPQFGFKILGAKRWLSFGAIRFQPAELAKAAIILWSAAYLANKKKSLPFLFILLSMIILIMLEPDLGTTIILTLSALAVYFVSGAPLWQFFLVGIAGLIGGTGLIMSSDYRRQRLMTFLNASTDPLGTSYHIRQVLLALGSGGLFGVGLGQSRQKYEYLPAVTTDSIFAVIGEEIGFIGASIILFAFLVFIWRGFRVALQAPDDFGRLLAAGITAWIGIQALVNLAAMVALVPLTGVPLPFISYGGSSLVLILTATGILVNISRFRVIKK